jgi:quercetin dioxygenase-like cupin family protein
MLQIKTIALGKLSGSIYDFPDVGDALPMHSHGEADVHITVVARGSFRVHGTGWERVLSAGDVADWQPNDPHEFVALEDNSRIVNIIKG